MNCDAFEMKLNNVLDAGLTPDADAELAEHARLCPGCRDLQLTYVATLATLSVLPNPQPTAGFADRVLAELKLHPTGASHAEHSVRGSKTALATHVAPWIMALAAGLLIAVWGPRPAPETGAPQNPLAKQNALAKAPAPPSPQVAVAAQRTPPPSFREVALLVPGLVMTETPGPVETGDWTSELSSGLKPLARSTSGALDLMLGALSANEPRGGLPRDF